MNKTNTISINDCITYLVSYAITNNLISEYDKVYVTNSLLQVLNIDSYTFTNIDLSNYSLYDILDFILDYAIKNHLIEDTQNSKDQFDTLIMSKLVMMPSIIINEFNNKYQISPKLATDYFYDLNKKDNYIRANRIEKDIKWKTNTKYGDMFITINLSKPEKDPRDIIKQSLSTNSNYPSCLLCKENEGYNGRINHPSRTNLRLIPIKLDNEQYYMQYSPYSYYNEHCIVLNETHKKMVINKNTFSHLFSFVDQFPHYFIGSNADLPIVGGSILSHDHYQGGRFSFPMDSASPIYNTKYQNIDKYQDVDISILNWPLSVIRLTSTNKDDLINLSDYYLNKWINYNNPNLGIINYTMDENNNMIRHNTITPIVRKENDKYTIDLVLRCNITDDVHPLGLFHPSSIYHHIKKENIGLIEVLGLAILPSRLKLELDQISSYLRRENKVLEDNLLKHKDWIDELNTKYDFKSLSKEETDNILKEEVGLIYSKLLEDCAVFKLNNNEGINEFKKFIEIK